MDAVAFAMSGSCSCPRKYQQAVVDKLFAYFQNEPWMHYGFATIA